VVVSTDFPAEIEASKFGQENSPNTDQMFPEDKKILRKQLPMKLLLRYLNPWQNPPEKVFQRNIYQNPQENREFLVVIVASDGFRSMRELFSSGALLHNLNINLIVLMPKMPRAICIWDYRLIALANFQFKIFTKSLFDGLALVTTRIILYIKDISLETNTFLVVLSSPQRPSTSLIIRILVGTWLPRLISEKHLILLIVYF